MVERRGNSLDEQTGDLEQTTYRKTFDWSTPDQPSVALIEVLAEIRGVDPTDLEPVGSYLDTDALDALFRRTAGPAPGAVFLTIDGYRISIGDGRIVAEPDVEHPQSREDAGAC